jgi:hypothetical protein
MLLLANRGRVVCALPKLGKFVLVLGLGCFVTGLIVILRTGIGLLARDMEGALASWFLALWMVDALPAPREAL